MKEHGLKGTIEMFVTDPGGKPRLVQKHSNTVMYPLMTKLALNLVADQDMVLGDLFVANTTPPTQSQDGIFFKDNDTGLYYSMITTTAHPTTQTIVFTGTFTGTAVKISTLDLGKGWLNIGTINGWLAPGTGSQDEGFAIATSLGTGWVETSFGAGQTVTINWTFETV